MPTYHQMQKCINAQMDDEQIKNELSINGQKLLHMKQRLNSKKILQQLEQINIILNETKQGRSLLKVLETFFPSI